jgi:uncharacterized protein YecT (DUF1311 family)
MKNAYIEWEAGMTLFTWATAIIFAFAFNISIGASDQTQFEMNQEACGKYKKADAELNRIYQQVLRDYMGDKNFIQKMRMAQRAWTAFRDAHVNSIYPDPGPQAYGSVNPICRCAILEQLTNDRIKMLSEWTDGVPEGNVCAGSQKIKR